MTPEREAYLENCSNREVWLRSAIRATKRDVSYQKQRITNANDEWIVAGAKCELWYEKQLLMTLRHELARLKGMDRVVVPKISYSSDDDFLIPIFECSCGMILYGTSCCERCGRKILWEKVK